MILKEYDVVVANKMLENGPKDTKGTILIVYEGAKQFEVEFVDEQGDTRSRGFAILRNTSKLLLNKKAA